MDNTTAALLGLLLLFCLMLLKMPISFSMFVVGFAGLLVTASPKAAFNVLTADLWNQFSSYTLSVIPMYILMGEVIFRTGVTEKLFKAAYNWVGQFRGGMASTVILASAGFSAVCGSNAATSAAMGTLALPELKKYKYNDVLSTGTVAAGGTLGVIIPPSTVLLVIALQTEQSIRELLVASIVPGILLTFLFLCTVFYLCAKNPEMGPAAPKTSFRAKLASLKGVIPILVLFAFVIGGLFLGWFTPTESGAFGAFGAMVISAFMGRLDRNNLMEALHSTIKSSCMVITLMISAMVFGRFLAITMLPNQVVAWANSLSVSPLFILFAVYLVFIIGGSLMDSLGFLIIAIPIFFPTVIALGYDPVWFSIMLCIITSAGAITPPVGVNVFVTKGISPGTPILSIYRGACYYLVSYLILILLLTAFPQIITFAV